MSTASSEGEEVQEEDQNDDVSFDKVATERFLELGEKLLQLLASSAADDNDTPPEMKMIHNDSNKEEEYESKYDDTDAPVVASLKSKSKSDDKDDDDNTNNNNYKDEFATLSKEFKELYIKQTVPDNDSLGFDDHAIINLALKAVGCIEKERSEYFQKHSTYLPLEETYGYKFSTILPLTDDEMVILLQKVIQFLLTTNMGIDDLSFIIGSNLSISMSTQILCCEIAIYRKFNQRIYVPKTPRLLAQILKEYMDEEDENVNFIVLCLTLGASFIVSERNDSIRESQINNYEQQNNENNNNRRPERAAEAILIPICFKIMGSSNDSVVFDPARKVAYETIRVTDYHMHFFLAQINNDGAASMINHIRRRITPPIRNLNEIDDHEQTYAGACLCLRKVVEERRRSENANDIESANNMIRNVQASMIWGLSVYPSNKVVVENNLSNLQDGSTFPAANDDDDDHELEIVTAFSSNQLHHLKVIIDAIRQTATPKAYAEGTRILHFLLKAGLDPDDYEDIDDLRETFLDLDGIKVILDATRVVPLSKALDVLVVCTIVEANYSSTDKIKKPIIETNSIGSIVNAINFYPESKVSERNVYPLLMFIKWLVSQNVRGSDGGSLLHYMAAAVLPSWTTTIAEEEEGSREGEGKTAWWVRQNIDFIRSSDRSLDLLRDFENRLPIHIAIQSKQSENVIRAYVEGNKSLCTELYDGLFPFQLAAQEDCDVGVINLLLKENPSGLKDVSTASGGGGGGDGGGVTDDLKTKKKRGKPLADKDTEENDGNEIPEKKKPKAMDEV